MEHPPLENSNEGQLNKASLRLQYENDGDVSMLTLTYHTRQNHGATLRAAGARRVKIPTQIRCLIQYAEMKKDYPQRSSMCR